MAASASRVSLSPRALRFQKRLNGEREPTFAIFVRQRNANRLLQYDGDDLARAVAVLQAKPALDKEVGGLRLQQLANALGEDLLDALLEVDLLCLPQDVLHDDIPQSNALTERGYGLIAQAGDNPQIARLVQRASDLLRRVNDSRECAA
ncbi:hypothetical protein [Erythrobacter sp. YT30]|uniref:hypothetical protein n=1 Tax=Erythrobacter sp. YT30 TaxID=1735012 RepID=UPI00076BC5FE|nr:hypothetical protein [Erythrobacter sp. YT30]KWV92083.1 hypothetical protein AUC45_13125 [Erythrobacter sp. YT30]